ncbi:tRNA pseudouridine(55) synthase TruB [Oceanobacillus sp. CAU 1775]
MDGILPLWKPRGMTSHDCVMKIRRLYKTKKVGHTGTLDPEVEGVLPICIGQATKVVPYLTDTKKTYIAEVKLGATTETEDSYGEIVEEAIVTNFPSESEIDHCLESFLGEITQIPPMYSAVKVNGRKLYEYARANETVERPTRQVQIFELEKLGSDPINHTIRFKVVCSKGTYIRTLSVDIGKKLGYPAHMSYLERTQTGSFQKEHAITFEMIEEAVENQEELDLLMPLITGLDHLPIIQVDEETKKKILFGQKLSTPEQLPETSPYVMMFEEELLAIYQLHSDNPNQIKALRVFNGF